jgi:tyrosine-protein kinase Etk/Wzc
MMRDQTTAVSTDTTAASTHVGHPAASRPDVVDVGRVVEAIRRNWRRIAGGVALGMAMSIIYLRIAVPRYEATATVRIDARQSTLPSIYAEQTVRDEVFTEIEVLRSRTIAADVVDELSLQAELVEPRRTPRDAVFRTLKVTSPEDTGTFHLVREPDGRYRVPETGQLVARGTPATVGSVTFVLAPRDTTLELVKVHVQSADAAIAELRREVDIGRAGLQAAIIALRYESEDPARARDVLNAWTSSFIRRRQSAQRTEATSTARFIQGQLDSLMPQLARAENRLLAYRNAHRIVAPELEAGAQVNQSALLQADRNELNAERGALQQALARVRAAAATAAPDAPSPYRDLLGFPTLLKNQAASELLRTLSTLDDQRTNLLIRRTPVDPDVIAISNRIRVVEGQLQGLATTYLNGLSAQVRAADASLARYASNLKSVPTREVEYARLQRAPRVYEELVSLLQTRLKEAQITEAVKDASVRVVDEAVAPVIPSSPNRPLALMFGMVGGLLLGAGLTFYRERSMSTVRTRRELQEVSGTPVLGLIPSFAAARGRLMHGPTAERALPPGGAALAVVSPRSTRIADLAAVEAFARLFMNVQWMSEAPLRSLLVTSPLPGDGKTTTAVHLAAAASRHQLRVLLVDADLRRGGLTSALQLRTRPGLVDFAHETTSLRDYLSSIVLPGGVPLDVVPAGSLSLEAGVPQVVKGLTILLEHAGDYDLVIIDTPPVNVVADAAAMAAVSDAVMLVTRSGATSPAAIDLALDQLTRAGARVLGTVLNGAEFQRSEGYGSIDAYRAYSMVRA